MTISANEWELLAFFSVEPTTVDADVSWPYNEYTYSGKTDGYSFRCVLSPADHGIEFSVKRENEQLYFLRARAAQDVLYMESNDTEHLKVFLSEMDHVQVTLRPSFQVQHDFETAT